MRSLRRWDGRRPRGPRRCACVCRRVRRHQRIEAAQAAATFLARGAAGADDASTHGRKPPVAPSAPDARVAPPPVTTAPAAPPTPDPPLPAPPTPDPPLPEPPTPDQSNDETQIAGPLRRFESGTDGWDRHPPKEYIWLTHGFVRAFIAPAFVALTIAQLWGLIGRKQWSLRCEWVHFGGPVLEPTMSYPTRHTRGPSGTRGGDRDGRMDS